MLIVDVLVPVFGLIFIGTFLSKMNLIGANGEKNFSSYVYFVALPATLLLFTLKTPLETYTHYLPFLIAISIGSAVSFFIIYFLKSSKKDRIINAISASSPNTGFMGIPVILAIFGEKGMICAIVGTVCVIALITIAIILLDSANNNHDGFFKRIYKTIINPPVFVIIVGVIISALGVKVPESINSMLKIAEGSLSPVALIVIGMSIKFRIPHNMGKLILITVSKLVIMPIVTFSILLLFNVPPLMMAAGLVLSSLPVGATCYILAQKYDANVEDTANYVMVTTIFSIITLSIILLVISYCFPSTLL